MPTLFIGIVPALVAYVARLAFGAAIPAHAEEESPIVQDWQKKGLLAALNDPSTAALKSTILHLVRQKEIAAILRAPTVDKLTAKTDEARATLDALKEARDMSNDLPQLRQDLARSIGVVVNVVSWEASDLPLLEEHEQGLREGGFSEADTVQRVVGGLETSNQIEIAGEVWFAHVLFWWIEGRAIENRRLPYQGIPKC